MKWITVEYLGASDSGKTFRWGLRPVDGFQNFIGFVRWYGPWRKYIFEPEPRTIFEQDCLRDIADFCEAKTKEHRSARKAALNDNP